MAGTNTKLWCIEVTEEQEMVIRALYGHNDWDLIEHPYPTLTNDSHGSGLAEGNLQVEQQDTAMAGNQSSSKRTGRKRKNQRELGDKDSQPTSGQAANSTVTATQVQSALQVGQAEDMTMSQSQPETTSSSSSSHDQPRSETECLDCFCDPCVTSRPQKWLGSGNPPGAGNSSLRRVFYKKYWKMLSDRCAWYDSRYVDKKTRMWQAYKNGLDQNNCWVPGRHSPDQQSVREIMPDCVLRQVRKLYPNPSHIPYMDHKFF
ncbi:uncharacterized protein LOC118411091 [Branchiostoma floridae]|uniref:Uncharacterized protein LOC118410965 n=1 Tax=Branchiostoma floridae TaxID=7739 RepID=A0A9J7MIT9_BRAFL|nr:uncharacterized protein LOC118410965 [Branchiostoma floridae]XP_035669017.1 uncharacterized protein LOC118411091 [Branchiostoma floridae]